MKRRQHQARTSRATSDYIQSPSSSFICLTQESRPSGLLSPKDNNVKFNISYKRPISRALDDALVARYM
jgi:hypothetical protein